MFHFFRESNECLPILFRSWAFTRNIPQCERKKGIKYMLNYMKAYNCHLSCQHSFDLDDGLSQFSLIGGASTKAPDGERVNSPSVIFIHGLSTYCHFPTATQMTGVNALDMNKIKKPAARPNTAFRVYLLIKFLQLYILDH